MTHSVHVEVVAFEVPCPNIVQQQLSLLHLLSVIWLNIIYPRISSPLLLSDADSNYLEKLLRSFQLWRCSQTSSNFKHKKTTFEQYFIFMELARTIWVIWALCLLRWDFFRVIPEASCKQLLCRPQKLLIHPIEE